MQEKNPDGFVLVMLWGWGHAPCLYGTSECLVPRILSPGAGQAPKWLLGIEAKQRGGGDGGTWDPGTGVGESPITPGSSGSGARREKAQGRSRSSPQRVAADGSGLTPRHPHLPAGFNFGLGSGYLKSC